eukprot:SM000026S08896  [mRNA]  locus=s26:320151:326233:+ [translate_table: standard]
MANNEWINGYLEAIIDSAPIEDQRSRPVEDDLKDSSNPAIKYFIKEITEGIDELDLHRSWLKATATKNVQDRENRLENASWRIWHLIRRRRLLNAEERKRLAQRQIEKAEAGKDAEDIMPDEYADDETHLDVASDSAAPVASQAAAPGGEEEAPQERRLYIVMTSLHGLVRGEHMELGRDSDTGGQIKYVVEFARALATMPEVRRVDLLTRLIADPEVDSSYAEETEVLLEEDAEDGSGVYGAYIVRIPCGPREKYIQKELLWPYLPEFVDGALEYITSTSKNLGRNLGEGQPVWPHVIHGHYADAGDISALLSGAFNVPMVLTGHSLGRNKLEQLLKQRQSREQIDATYKIMRRIEAEELALDAAELVVTSTRQEIDEQWGLYDGFDVKLERVLRLRQRRGENCHGRFMPRMAVIPPGMDFSHVVVQDPGDVFDTNAEAVAFTADDASQAVPVSPRNEAPPPIWGEVQRFFSNPHKPIILALARPDPKKNLMTLVKAYGECKPLRELANLCLIMGNRKDIDELSGSAQNVLTGVLKLIDKYDLYGQVAYPKRHKQPEVPLIYRLAAKTKGVFVNPALVEPFGLTLIEAAAYGLPMVATKNGGPVDIQRTLSNGLLVDPHDDKAIADALLKLVGDRKMWVECRRSGLRNIHAYSWPEHCRTYLSKVAMCRMRHPQWRSDLDTQDTESATDSLRGIGDLSLRMSLDARGSLKALDMEKLLLERGTSLKPGLKSMQEEDPSEDHSAAQQQGSADAAGAVGSHLKQKKRLFVVAVDDYSSSGEQKGGLLSGIQALLQCQKDGKLGKDVALGVATAMVGREVLDLLERAGVSVQEIDVLIAGSGSELYYPSAVASSESGKGGPLVVDPDYAAHIDYRWGGDGLRRTMARLTSGEADGLEGRNKRALIEESSRCGQYRLVYRVNDPGQAPTQEDLRKKLRMRGLRCHAIYVRGDVFLHLLPLHASRAQALRYLFVRWGLELSRMVVLAGPNGDGDYMELLPGLHGSIVLQSAASEESASETPLHPKSEEGVFELANVVTLDLGPTPDAIVEGLGKLDSSRDQ